MLKTILTGFILGLVLILAVPATLILASWNAVPSDSSYKIKVGLEKAILGVTLSDNLKTSLEIKYTERRFNEVEKLIETDVTKSKLVDESLTNLTNQAIASKNSLQKIQNSEEKTVQTENLIATLESISVKIEEKKQISNTTSVPTNISTKISTNTPLSITIQPSPTFTPSPAPTQNIEPIVTTEVVVVNLEDTQQKLNEIINELKDSPNKSDSNGNKNSPKKDKNNSSNENVQEKNDKDKNDRRP